MDTRLVLQIILGIITVLILVLGVVTIIALVGDAETVVVEDVAEEVSDEEQENPWAGQGDAAIGLVQRLQVESDPDVDGGGDGWTVGELIEHTEFVESTLDLGAVQPQGWEVDWWGETRFGPSFYLVRYGFSDENVTIGPTWLVDLRSQKVVPKNVLAEVVTDPEQGVESDYFDQARQVVAAIINHRFPSGVNLGGALLLYFEDGEKSKEDDRVIGWTVDHSREELFQAYFQWTDDGEEVYAKFEFDFEEHALRPANLQANEIMRVGESFEPFERVEIMPGMYDPDETIPANRWQGGARRQCNQSRHRESCKALAMILDESELIETLEWTLTADADSASAFEECRTPDEDAGGPPPCRWGRDEIEDGVFRIHYRYDLGDGPQKISWDVHVDDERIVPVDDMSELAYRAVRPRG